MNNRDCTCICCLRTSKLGITVQVPFERRISREKKMLQKLVPGLCASLVLISATSLTGCSTDTKTATTASDADKSETVYVKADASGTINEIKVQTDLKNTGTSKEIKDFSTLKDIKNTKGNESFTQSSDGTITWENKGG